MVSIVFRAELTAVDDGVPFAKTRTPRSRGLNHWCKMTQTELIIQLLKVAIGLAFGAYFVWWSLEVLDRLTPESDPPAALVGHISKAKAAPVGVSWSLTP
jgi:hypothetical protein